MTKPGAPAGTPEPGRIADLLAIMAKLRDPNGGCPWDLEQSFDTIWPYTVEEGYEVADAIRRGSMSDLKDELGDLLFQVVYHAQMAAEAGHFTFADVVDGISDKMVRRHPHVFGPNEFGSGDISSAEAQTESWEQIKAKERAAKAADKEAASLLDDVPVALPGLLRALKLQKRAARCGFDWPDARRVMDKMHEEIGELTEELEAETLAQSRVEEEMGDLLFVAANLARKLDVDPEVAVQRCNDKFTRRFQEVERRLAAQGSSVQAASLDEMEALWSAVKDEEKRAK